MDAEERQEAPGKAGHCAWRRGARGVPREASNVNMLKRVVNEVELFH